jgi:hypothetical protein
MMPSGLRRMFGSLSDWVTRTHGFLHRIAARLRPVRPLICTTEAVFPERKAAGPYLPILRDAQLRSGPGHCSARDGEIS